MRTQVAIIGAGPAWWFTALTHRFPETAAFERRLQRAEFDYLAGSRAAQTSLAENYVGLPYGNLATSS